MNAKLIIAASFFAVIAGCSTSPQAPHTDSRLVELQSYVATQKPLAEKGEIKWSEYYIGLIDRHNRVGFPQDIIELGRQMLLNAQQMESGVITHDVFEYRQQDIRSMISALAQQHQAQDRAQQQANLGLAMQLMQRNQSPPYQLPTPAVTQANTVRPIQIQPMQPQVAATATAYWTGKQTQVQTVTYQSGWNCEYNYAGRTFWRTFVGTCPTSVQVQ